MTTAIIKAEAREVQSKNFIQGELVERFIKFAGVMPKSAATYKIALRQLFKYFSANEINQPTRENILDWVESLKNAVPKKSPRTVQLYLTACKIFFRWLAQEKIYPNVADHIKAGIKISHEHAKEPLSAVQAGSLIKGVKGDSLKAKRDKAIIALMVATGIRGVEVVRADVGDIVPKFGKSFLKIQGKGHSAKDAEVLLPAQVEKLIDDYLQARGNVADDEPLFTSISNRNKGSRLTTQTISKMCKANLRAAGFDSKVYTAHSLRHTAFTTMLLNGCRLESVQMCARHISIVTTQIYNHSVERMKNTAEQTAANAIFDSIISA